MATIAYPTLSRNPDKFQFGQVSNTSEHISPLSSTVQTVEYPAPRWKCAFSYSRLTEDDAALLQAFFVQLRGRSGRFTIHNLARPIPRGIATGTPVVSGASQTGTTVNTSGWTPSQTGILKAGDYFSIGSELKMVTADADSDGGGLSTISFEAPIRTSPGDASPVVVTNPTATFMLTSDEVNWETKAPIFTSFNVQGLEVL